METISDNAILGTLFIAAGAFTAAFCYTPQHKLRGWSWQTYWIAQSFFCWFLLPLLGAALTIPELPHLIATAPRGAMLLTFGLGAAFGVGGTAFGLAIRNIGYSLTYAISIGISCILGTLTGPIIKGELAAILEKQGSGWIMGGVLIGLLGMLLCGLAGRLKELELQGGGRENFHLLKGLMLCLVAGVLSAVYGIAVNDSGAPLAAAAAEAGAGHWQTNFVFIFANTGAFLSSLAYCLWLARRERSFGEFARAQDASAGALPMNYGLAFATGLMWYGQFLLYGLGYVRMGQFKFSSWAIHMILLILFSSVIGIAMKEWHGRSARTKLALAVALSITLGAVLLITYGNYLGQ
jgi:L-rhamnose-H+ transport protein